jgi:predicted RNase H-like HicB family nuclease
MEFNVHVEWAETNACANIDEVPGFIITSKTVKSLQNEIRAALEFHANGCIKAGKRDEWLTNRLEWKFTWRYGIGALLNLYSGILTQSNLARITGINASLMRQYLGGYRNPSKKQLEKVEKNLRTFAADLSNIKIV